MMVEVPFTGLESVPVWFLVVTAVLSHARGTVLLLREIRLWFLKRDQGKTPRY